MAGGISIDILANVRDALRGTGDLEQALSDIESTLEDMSRSGDKSLDKMSRGFRDLTKDADTTADKIDRSAKQVGKSFDKAGKEIGQDLSKGYKVAAQASDNLKEEAGETAREVAASFDGSAESITGGVQELAANALNSFGIVGAAAGGVIAGGIGLVTAALTHNSEALDATREKFGELYRSAAEDGRTFLTEAEIQSGVYADLFDPTNNFEKRRKYQDEAVATGRTLVEIAQAHNGSEEEVNKTIEAGSEKVKKLQEDWSGLPGTIDPAQIAAQSVVDTFKQQSDVMDDQKKVAKQLADSQVSEQKRVQGEAQRTKEFFHEVMNGTYNATIRLNVDRSAADETLRQVYRDIDGRVSYIKVGTQILS